MVRKKDNNKVMFGVLIGAFAVLLGIIIVMFTGWRPGAIGGEDGSTSDVVNVGAGDCNTVPTISLAVRDAMQQGTSVTTGVLYRVNDVYYGSTVPTLASGDEVQLILNSTGYIDFLTEPKKVICGSNPVSALIEAYQAPTVEFKDDNTVLTDVADGSGVNGSAVLVGGSQTFEVCLTGTDKKTTGDAVYVLELGSTTNVSSIRMYNANGELQETDVPGFYVDTLTSPFKTAFILPEIENAVESCYSMTIVAKSGKAINGAVYSTAYVGEPIVEDDGTFVAFAVEQKDGDSDYEATWDSDFTLA